MKTSTVDDRLVLKSGHLKEGRELPLAKAMTQQEDHGRMSYHTNIANSKLQLPIMIYKFFEASFNFLTAIICICTYILHVLQNTNI